MKKSAALFILFACAAWADDSRPQSAPQEVSAWPISENAIAAPAKTEVLKVVYVDQQLTISGRDTTLAEILTKVAAATGVLIDLPEGANRERLPLVKFGPGTPREVLASLLSDSSFDYLIQASDGDTNKLQSVLLMPRPKKGAPGTEAANSPRQNSFARASAVVSVADDAPVADNSGQASAQNTPTEPNPENRPAQAEANTALRTPIESPRPFALSPPEVMNSQNINQQLQQMYQQRMQMNKSLPTPPPPQ